MGDDPVDGSDPSGFGPDTGTYYRVVTGAVDKPANWSLKPPDLANAIAKQTAYYNSLQTNPGVPVEIDGLSVWATPQQAAENYQAELAAGKAHGTGKLIEITQADLTVAHLQAVEDPMGNPALAAQGSLAYVPALTGHYLLIPDQPDNVNPNEQAAFGTLGQTVNQTDVGRITEAGKITYKPPPTQSSSVISTIANVAISVGQAVVQAAVLPIKIVAIVLTGAAVVPSNRAIAF